MFTPDQIHQLLEILNKQNLIFISSKLGPNYLTHEEIKKLQSFGINPFHLYTEAKDIALMSFHFGLLSDVLGAVDAKQANFEQLKSYIESGKHIPLTKIEINTIDSIKRQYLGDIKANNGRIFQDVNNIIGQSEKNNRLNYEKVIRGEIEQGILMKKTTSEIARNLARKTGDWSRNFKRIVEYISHQAFDEGRAAIIQEKYGNNALVYKNVYLGACTYCIKAYLTKGVGSQPIIFKLSQLKANGTNIGRKPKDYKPVIGNHHPSCRCTLHEYNGLFDWDEQKQSFSKPKEGGKSQINKLNRKPIRITFNGKEYSV